jgi:hypothetical protein
VIDEVSHKAMSLYLGSTVQQNTTTECMFCKGINIISASYKQDQTTAGKGSYVAVSTAVSIFDKNARKSASSMKSSFKTCLQMI